MSSLPLPGPRFLASYPSSQARASIGRHGRSGSIVVRPPRRVFLVRRLGVLFVVTLAAIAVSLLISTRFADAGSAGRLTSGSSVNVVVVQPGDTFWKLARSVQPSGDVRPLIAQLARQHGGSALQAGDRIVLPER